MNKNFNGSVYTFIDCKGINKPHPYRGTYPNVIVGGLDGLLNALIEMRPTKIIRME